MRKVISFFIFFLILFISIKAYSQIVVFPFEDFTSQDNGINFEVPDFFAKKLKEKGIKTIFPEKIVPILIKYRQVNFSQLNFTILREIYKKFKAQYVMLGTITNLNKKEPSIALVLRIIDVSNGKVIWGGSASFAGRDFVSILDLKKIDYKEMLEDIFNKLFANFKEKIKPVKRLAPTVDIQEVNFNARYIKGGKEVECIVRLVFSGPKPQSLGIETYTISGKKIIPLKHFLNERSYLATWKAPLKEGRYPVILIVTWNHSWNIKKKIFIATYYVDNTPPALNVIIKGAKKEKGKILVKDILEIMPKVVGTSSKGKFWGRGNGISRWEIEIYSKRDKTTVLKESYPGELPEVLSWFVKRNHSGIPPGEYIIKFKVWDLAGNFNEVDKEVTLVTEPPIPEVVLYKEEEGPSFLEVKVEENYVPLIKINIEIFNGKGEKIAEIKKEGAFISEMRKEIVLNKYTDIKGLYFNAEIEDELRNKKVLKRIPIEIKKKFEKNSAPVFKTWINEF